MERFLAGAIEAIGKKVAESFSSRAADQMADNALNSMNNMKDFEHIFENLKKNLHALSARAADVEEEITNRERSDRKKRKREVEEWLEEVESIKEVVAELECEIESEGFVTRMTDGGKAAQLDKLVEKLVEQSQNFGELVLDVCGTSGEAFLTRGLVGRAFGENVEKILRLLESGQVSSIGLYGMGGVGKTTLAQHINNRLKQDPERSVYWVTVSQEFTVKGLQDKIARLSGVKLSAEDEVGQRAMRLQTALSQQKSSVLILDDVWDNIDLSDVGCDPSVDGCKLIITTRSVGVCRGIGCKEKIPVEILGDEEAWKLFRERLGNGIELVPEVEEIAKGMVKLCGGLPLGIITVAGSMRGKSATEESWKNAFRELKEHVVRGVSMGEDKVFQVLKYSFDRLKEKNDNSNEFNTSQLCFLYCLLYPEDHEIERELLVIELISDGQVSRRKMSRRAQVCKGQSILDELVNVCLLEKCVDSGGKECVKMHDLVRDMAVKVVEGKYMVRAGVWSLEESLYEEEERTKSLEKVSYICSDVCRIEDGVSPNFPNLSTLLLRWNPWDNIPASFFSKMERLCTLDLCGNNNIKFLPNSVSDLTSLKSLLLEDCRRLEKVPYLGKMKALRELNLSYTAIREVPAGVDELVKLEFLSLKGACLRILPRGLLPKLVHLQHVSIPFHIEVPVEEMQNLKLLEEFNGCVERVEDFNIFMRNREHLRERDTWYKITVGGQQGHSFEDSAMAWYSQRLEEDGAEYAGYLGYSSYKRMFCLFECNLEEKTVIGHDTEYAKISLCTGLSNSFLDGFSELKRLQIAVCSGIEWILRSDCQFSDTLQQIDLVTLHDLKGVGFVTERGETGPSITAPSQPAVFSALKRLTVFNCGEIRKVGLSVSEVPNLEIIFIAMCGKLEEVFKEDEGRATSILTTLSKLRIFRLDDLPMLRKVRLPVSGLSNLERFVIDNCGEIEELFEEDEGRVASILTALPKLRSLKLSGAQKLKKVGLLPNLEEIVIKDCGEMEEIFEEDVGRRAAGSILPRLKHLELSRLPRLRKVELPALPNLEEIVIKDCGEMEEIFEEDVGRRAAGSILPRLKHLELSRLPRLRKVELPALPNLEEIVIKDCGEMEEIFEEYVGRRAAGSNLPRLKHLELSRLPRLRKVGLPVSALPNVKQLTITWCGEIKEIFKEEDEGRVGSIFPKLMWLSLSNLARLRKVGLPAASGVPNLERIWIESCCEIQEIFEDEDEDEGRAAADSILPRLKHLYLYKLPRLKRVSKATIISNSIQTIDIRKCPELVKKKLPLHFGDPGPPPSLLYIEVERGWWESLEWDNPLLPQLLQPFLRFEDEEGLNEQEEDEDEDGDGDGDE